MSLLRGLVSARTWLAFTHHIAGLLLATAAFTIVVTGVALGIGLLPLALVGVPVLGLTSRFADWFAAVERARFALLLDSPVPDWPVAEKRYRALLLPRRGRSPAGAPWGGWLIPCSACR